MQVRDWDYVRHRRLAELGAALGPSVREPTIAMYLPLHPGEPRFSVVRDCSYGPHDRHRLDVHLPEGLDVAERPVHVFVHGGGFVGGDKRRAGEPFYDNIGQWAASCGFIGVTITYRLAPESTYPSGGEDVAAALRWVQANIAAHGGSPDRVVVMGHSAGGAHVATFLARSELIGSLEQPLAGAILSSGIYHPSNGSGSYGVYFGEDPALLAERSAIDGLCALDLPLLVSTAELDPPEIQLQTERLLFALFERRGRFPEIVQAETHNHFSVMQHIGTSETWYSDRLARFVTATATADASPRR